MGGTLADRPEGAPILGPVIFKRVGADRPYPEYSPEKARALVAQSDYHGETILFESNPAYYTYGAEAAEAIVEMWKDVGINAELRLTDTIEGTLVRNWSNTARFPDPAGGLWLLWFILNAESTRSFFGLSSQSSLVLIVLLPFLLSLAGTLISPAVSAISRRFERAADRAALELTEDVPAFIDVEKKLVRKAKADLLRSRLLHCFYGSHPLAEQRIRVAESFAAQERSNPQPAD